MDDERQNPRDEPATPPDPWVVDAGPYTTPEDRAWIQDEEDLITRADRRDRGW